MKFYRVHETYGSGISAGFRYFTSLRSAKEYGARQMMNNAKQTPGILIAEISFDPTKYAILGVLNRYASHPDNG
jgi:hypothetical protein